MSETTLCYLERGGAYLMLHRTKKPNDLNRGKWIGVGGKFEQGESPEDCMKREIFEETGFTVRAWRYRGIVTFVSVGQAETEYMHLFTVSDWEGTQRICGEGDLQWIGKDALDGLPMWEGDRLFLRLLREDAPFFSLKLVYTGEHLTAAELNGKEISCAF